MNKNMNEQVLTIEQMQELIALGVDTSKASMCWFPMMELDENMKPVVKSHFIGVNTIDFDSYWNTIEGKNTIKTFTLQDILEMLPREVKEHHFILEDNCDEWDMYYFLSVPDKQISTIGNITGKTLLEAAFTMLKWCKQNNYI